MFRDLLLGKSEDLFQHRKELRTLVFGLVDSEQILTEGKVWEWPKKYKSHVKPGNNSVDSETEIYWEQLAALAWRGQLALVRQIGKVDKPERTVDVIVFGEGE